MTISIGPFDIHNITLCTGDASPDAQQKVPGPSANFFPGAKWIGAFRNAADKLGCKFAILTTAYGMVGRDDLISPYDLHISTNKEQVIENWSKTIPKFIGQNQTKLLIFHAGGCPDDYREIIKPIVHFQGISLIVYGRPNMFDIGMIYKIVEMVTASTTADKIKSILRCPERFEYVPLSFHSTSG